MGLRDRLLLLGGLFCGAALLLVACEEAAPPVEERIRALKTMIVTDVASGQLRRFPGVVAAVDTSALSFEVGGNTREVLVNVGDKVEEGQILASLDDAPFQLNVEAAAAELGRAKAQLAEKQNMYDRQDTLYKKEWVSKAALDQAVASRESAANEVAYASSKLNLARRDLDKTVLAAPFSGVIASKDVEPFQEVARGEPVFELYAEGAMQVELAMPETAIADIYVGMPAEVSFPGNRNEAVPGRVSEIGTVAGDANAFPVKVALVAPPESILPGMTAEAALKLGTPGQENSYLLPISALAVGDKQGEGFVFLYDAASGTVKKTAVKGGGVRDNLVVVTSGVSSGDRVAVAGVSFLFDGQKVKLLEP